MSKLFSPNTFKSTTLKNRIVMSPMCMYSSIKEDGQITDFHMPHYISRAIGGVGLVMVEATAVKEEGRISLQDLGIWSDAHIDGFKALNDQIHQYGAKSAIQLAHAGRKAVLPSTIYAPSPVAFNDTSKVPAEMTISDIQETIEAFRLAAIRSKQAGFDVIEIHAAHGYLLNQFLSPLTNKRKDKYGGNRENRYRMVEEVIDVIKSEWEGPLFIRISADEYDEEGNSFEDILYFAAKMKEQGIDLIDCSSGGVVPARISTYPGYQVKLSEKVKQEVNTPTGAVGLITTGIQAEEIVQNERADLVFIGRALLRNPYWPKAAADELNYTLEAPQQYERGWK